MTRSDTSIKVSQTKSAAVNTEVFWLSVVSYPPPTGVKLQLINSKYGVAVYGNWSPKDTFWTHWQGLPKFKD